MIHSGPMAAATLATVGNLGFAFLAAALPEERSMFMDTIEAALVPGRFVSDGSDVKKIHDGKIARDFRICVKGAADTASMKVTYDAQSVMLAPGECRDIVGKTIEATPAVALAGAAHIVATAHGAKK
jgi:hypothetical protein